MKSLPTLFLLACGMAAGLGCAEPREASVPIYAGAPAHASGATPQPIAGANAALLPPPGFSNVAPDAPPASPIETPSPTPTGDYLWIPGRWGWNGTWVWLAGGWVLKPYVTARWEPGYWEQQGKKYFWVEGQWR
jgi:hypothetical protein